MQGDKKDDTVHKEPKKPEKKEKDKKNPFKKVQKRAKELRGGPTSPDLIVKTLRESFQDWALGRDEIEEAEGGEDWKDTAMEDFDKIVEGLGDAMFDE